VIFFAEFVDNYLSSYGTIALWMSIITSCILFLFKEQERIMS